MRKKVFIIGAGSAFAQDVQKVLAVDNEVIAAGRKDSPVTFDVNDADKQTIPRDVDTIISFAAHFGGTGDDEILDDVETNVLGTLRVCIAAKKANVKHLIIISSMSAVHSEGSPYYTVYAITKRQGDELAEYYCKLKAIPLTIIRPTQIYGDSNRFAKRQPLFYLIIDKAQKGEDIPIYGQNDALRNYIHSEDLAEVIHKVVEKKTEGLYTCMYPQDVTISNVAHAAHRVFGKEGKIIFQKDKPDIPDNVFAEDLTIYRKIGYYPKISLNEGMQRIKNHRESENL